MLLIPEPEEHAKYIQIYFLDSQESIEIRWRILQNDVFQCNIVELLETILRQHNQYIKTLLHAKERIRTFLRQQLKSHLVRDQLKSMRGGSLIKLLTKWLSSFKIIMRHHHPHSTLCLLREEDSCKLYLSHTNHMILFNTSYSFHLESMYGTNKMQMTNNKILTGIVLLCLLIYVP